MTTYLVALALTLLVEALVVAAIAPREQRGRLVLTSVFINLVTHPLANHFFDGSRRSFLLVEGAVVVVESLLFVVVCGCGPLRGVALALAANVVSLSLSRFFS